MARNTGDVDRTARLLLGGALALPIIPIRALTGTLGDVVGAIALYLLITALMGWDPLYMVLRISTRTSSDVDAKSE